jgi:coniferyl-aldehyde dehydrogenase
MISEGFTEDQVAVITGGPAVGEAFTTLKWDHLFYTGSTQIGRLVAKAAAENLVPTTLELGGKSPAIVCEDYALDKAAARIGWGKLFNAGQTCVAPDYVLTPKGKEREFADGVIAAAQAQFPDASSDDAYASIVSDRHFERLNSMIDEARAGGAEILQPEHDSQAAQAARKVPPTVVLNPPAESKLMQEEIFGPILPVIGYSNLDDATDYVTEREHPLALYVFTEDKAKEARVLDATQSGGAAVNTALLHLSVPDLPFGGVGHSGQGAYHGEAGFLTFTHERSPLSVPSWHLSKLMAPPYGKFAENMIKRQLK